MELKSNHTFPIKGRGLVYVIDCQANGLDYGTKEDRPFKLGEEITINGDTFKIYGIDDCHYLARRFSEQIGIMKEIVL